MENKISNSKMFIVASQLLLLICVSLDNVLSKDLRTRNQSVTATDGAGHIYKVWNETFFSGENALLFASSIDGGREFSVPIALSIGDEYNPEVAVTKSRSITVTWQGSYDTFMARSANSGITFSRPIAISAPNGIVGGIDGKPLPGWPQSVYNGGVHFSPASLGDIDGDGKNEVVATLGGLGGAFALYAWHDDGRGVVEVEGQPNGFFSSISESGWWLTPALADLYNEGKLKIVLGTQSGVQIFNEDATSTIIESGVRFITKPVVIEDMDGDGSLEIIAVSDTCPRSCDDPAPMLYVWDRYGNPLPGWPQTMPIARSSTSSLAVGDLDGDGLKEIVIAVQDGSTLDPPIILAYNLDGTIKWSYTIEADDWCRLGDIELAITLGDVDNDGKLEVVFLRNGACSRQRIHHFGILDGKGQLRNEWFLSWAENWLTFINDLPLADLNGDSNLEIIITSNSQEPSPRSRIYAWHHTGNLVDGFPTASINDVIFTPMVADVDGDMTPDIVSSLSVYRRDSRINPLYAWSQTGRLIEGWPKFLPRFSVPSAINSSYYTTLGDVDGDGTIDLIASVGGGELHIITLGTKLNPRTMHWPTYRHDFRHTGRYGN